MSVEVSTPCPSASARRRAVQVMTGLTLVLALSACGGGGGSAPVSGGAIANGSGSGSGSSNVWKAGVYLPASGFKSQCTNPRSGSSTITGRAFPDVKGSVITENNWLRSWTNELYLWYREVPDLDPALYATSAYFDLLKTSQTTASGAQQDQFHFTSPTATWESFSQSGTSAGYGAQLFFLKSTPPRKIIVALTEPGSPAAAVGLRRGDEIIAIDGVDSVSSTSATDIAALNAGLTPKTLGERHTFTIRRSGAAALTVTMNSANVTSTPVQNVHRLPGPNADVGYLLFNDHIATAESQLIAAVNTLKLPLSIPLADLVLDIRYNGGGYLDIASELAYMIAGSSRTAGMTFERITLNDKNPTTNPVTGEALTPTPFLTKTQGFSTTSGAALPTLNLSRVYVLTSGDTCSASEAIINSLRGVGVDVIQIGSTTCGKPYGFYATDNCGTTYFSVQFKGVNAAGFGDYSDGFSPQNTLTGRGVAVDGCSVADDFDHQLGEADEGMLKAALNYRMNPLSCPSPAAGVNRALLSKTSGDPGARTEGRLLKPEWAKNRILRTEQQ